ncbi:MAG: hypothetical protein PHT37_08825 [Candidatus Cloacimonetes bacterium]|nr:hypothetical protein [Candidatus Cloacimonadota bacterium]
MKKLIKQILLAGGLLFIGYQAFRMIRLIRAIIALDKSLPEYLESVYGEAPKVGCTLNAHITVNTKIVVKYSAEILTQHDDIEAKTREYIADFYPLLANSRLKVNVVEASL